MAVDLDRHYEGAGRYWGIDPDVLRAVHQVEDPSGDPDIKSRSGAVGHMQFMPKTANALGIDPHDPVQSIYGAARLLRENVDRYRNLPDALRAYNGGTDQTKWGNPETMSYPQKVADRYAALRSNGQEDPFSGPGIPAQEAPGAPSDAFERAFGDTGEHGPKRGRSADPFDSVFGHEAESALPAKAHAHQGTWYGNLAQFGSDAIDAAVAEGVKAGANVIDGVTLHKLHGTEIDPRLFKKAAQMEIDSQRGDWGATAAHLGGALLGDGLVAGTVGRAVPSIGSGMAANALTQGIVGASTAKLVDQDPVLGGALGAASTPVGALASRVLGRNVARTAADEASAARSSEGNTGGGATPNSGEQEVIPPSRPSPEAIKLGILASPKQADRLAQRIWDDYQKGGPVQLVESKIPGVRLTAAQATGNAGLAQLERVRRSLNPNLFTAIDAQNAAARNAFARKVIGTEDQLDAAEAARSALEEQHREAAFANQQPVDVAPIREHLARLIDDNRGRETVQTPLIQVLKQVNAVADEDGTAMPDKLWNVRKYLGDMVAPRAQGTANDGHAAASQLLDLKPTLTEQIDAGAPGFKSYLQHYEEMSRPIDAMQFLQSRKLTNAQGDVQLGKLDSFLDAIKRDKRKPGSRQADSVTPEQFAALENLRDDMRLHARIDLGKARGSDTNVNLITSGKVAKIAQGVAPKLAAMAGGALEGGAMGGLLANGAAGLVEKRLIGRMANTQAAVLDYLDNALVNPRLSSGDR